MRSSIFVSALIALACAGCVRRSVVIPRGGPASLPTPGAPYLRPAAAWQNVVLPVDVNGDGIAEISDVEALVDFLRDNGNAPVSFDSDRVTPGLFDVNGDGLVSLLDLLTIVSHLRALNAGGTPDVVRVALIVELEDTLEDETAFRLRIGADEDGPWEERLLPAFPGTGRREILLGNLEPRESFVVRVQALVGLKESDDSPPGFYPY